MVWRRDFYFGSGRNYNDFVVGHMFSWKGNAVEPAMAVIIMLLSYAYYLCNQYEPV